MDIRNKTLSDFGISPTTFWQGPDPTHPFYIPYGTSGFRGDSSKLEHVMYRSGLLFTLLANNTPPRTSPPVYFGVMITASHNPADDNGIKFVDPTGREINSSWEKYLTEFINSHLNLNVIQVPSPTSPSSQDLINTKNLQYSLPYLEETLLKILEQWNHSNYPRGIQNQENFDNHSSYPIRILIGRDTRPSSPRLQRIFTSGVLSANGIPVNVGELTTPQLHFLVERANTLQLQSESIDESIYYSFFDKQLMKFNATFNNMKHGMNIFKSFSENNNSFQSLPIIIDGANGVGADKIEQISESIEKYLGAKIMVVNNGQRKDDILNFKCGSDFVEKKGIIPKNCENIKNYQKGVSFDGDADRIIYFTTIPNHDKSILTILNGDRIMALYSKTIISILNKIFDTQENQDKHMATHKLTLGFIQTAYANGNSTRYICNLFPPQNDYFDCIFARVKTGVKNLMKKGEDFDISISFEANGHGSVITKFDHLNKWADELKIRMNPYYEILASFLSLFNQSVGDAISNLIAVETALSLQGYTLKNWAELFLELPTIQTSIRLPRHILNRFKLHPEFEDILYEPTAIKVKLESIISDSKDKCMRAFIRPSGTENVCRIFCEASTHDLAKCVANEIESMLVAHKF